MKFCAFIFCLVGWPLAINAQPLMSAQEFEAYTESKTFYYGSDGNAYGAEEYLKNRRVRWSFLDGECQEGYWYPEGDLICFRYDETPEPQCWSFAQSGGGLVARFENDPTSTTLYEVEQSSEPLLCLGPKIGV
ncbi:hypothetical protein ROA7450_00761 [Roseovarius albus]|uniref:Uncharacterized protein n=1 Tax=Roseovarius albus TaxID=1247867 RepID=A0A1X6YHR8_9RHOB|nr:hypothetical protein [Roseovarius albus]SLN21411.1 hypothetical protein ROA7450_00761 [Roseovarius albus]